MGKWTDLDIRIGDLDVFFPASSLPFDFLGRPMTIHRPAPRDDVFYSGLKGHFKSFGYVKIPGCNLDINLICVRDCEIPEVKDMDVDQKDDESTMDDIMDVKEIKQNLDESEKKAKQAVIHYVHEQFDMSFCKNTFDGRSITIGDLNALMLRETTTDNICDPQRMWKYACRGIKFVTPEFLSCRQLLSVANKI